MGAWRQRPAPAPTCAAPTWAARAAPRRAVVPAAPSAGEGWRGAAAGQERFSCCTRVCAEGVCRRWTLLTRPAGSLQTRCSPSPHGAAPVARPGTAARHARALTGNWATDACARQWRRGTSSRRKRPCSSGRSSGGRRWRGRAEFSGSGVILSLQSDPACVNLVLFMSHVVFLPACEPFCFIWWLAADYGRVLGSGAGPWWQEAPSRFTRWNCRPPS